jgi:hypothetical protein
MHIYSLQTLRSQKDSTPDLDVTRQDIYTYDTTTEYSIKKIAIPIFYENSNNLKFNENYIKINMHV